MAGTLEGLRVLDLSRILAGPLVGQMLGDLGAEVIKIERPGKGDESREMGPPFLKREDGSVTDTAGFYLSCNRNKQSIAIDISTPEGQELVRELAAKSDVLIENYKVGTLVRYGLDYESLEKVNPGLIYCSITGFGQTGPYAPKPGYDGIFQSIGGLATVSGHPPGTPGEGPMKVGISIVDIITSYNSVIAILAALHHRDLGHGGQAIDMSLLDCGVAVLSHYAQGYLISGEVPERRGNGGYGGIPSQAFQCSDRQIFAIAGNDSQFVRFSEAIGRPDLNEDPRFCRAPLRIANRKALLEILDAIFIEKPASEWVARLDAAAVPVSYVNDVSQAFADPQVIARGMKVEAPHPDCGMLPMVASPLRFSATPVERYDAPPALGEHTDAILQRLLGKSAEDVAALRASKAVG